MCVLGGARDDVFVCDVSASHGSHGQLVGCNRRGLMSHGSRWDRLRSGYLVLSRNRSRRYSDKGSGI